MCQSIPSTLVTTVSLDRLKLGTPNLHQMCILGGCRASSKMGHIDLVLGSQGSQTHQKVPYYHNSSWQIKARNTQSPPNMLLGKIQDMFAKWVTLTKFWGHWGQERVKHWLVNMITLDELKQGLSNIRPSCILEIYRMSLPNGSPWPSFGVRGVTHISRIALLSW